MTKETTYFIYKHTNKLNGKNYVGCSTNPLKRWRQGRGYSYNKLFSSDINTYGWENFSHELLFKTTDKAAASALETQLIAQYHPEYNLQHRSNTSTKPLNTKNSKPVLQLSKTGEVLNTFPSAAEAERATGAKYSGISYCCCGIRKSAGGYGWRFKETTE